MESSLLLCGKKVSQNLLEVLDSLLGFDQQVSEGILLPFGSRVQKEVSEPESFHAQ